jgi:hypothetical protein
VTDGVDVWRAVVPALPVVSIRGGRRGPGTVVRSWYIGTYLKLTWRQIRSHDRRWVAYQDWRDHVRRCVAGWPRGLDPERCELRTATWWPGAPRGDAVNVHKALEDALNPCAAIGWPGVWLDDRGVAGAFARPGLDPGFPRVELALIVDH